MTVEKLEKLESDIIKLLIGDKHPLFAADRDAALRLLISRQYSAYVHKKRLDAYLGTTRKKIFSVCVIIFVVLLIVVWIMGIYAAITSSIFATTIWSVISVTFLCILLPVFLVYGWRRIIATDRKSTPLLIAKQIVDAVLYSIGMFDSVYSIVDSVQNRNDVEYAEFLQQCYTKMMLHKNDVTQK